MSEDLRYPTGKFAPKRAPLTTEERAALVERIAALPAELRAALHGLDDAQLDTPYREGGWSPRQIAHHVADSHLNAFIRVKLALTEDRPTVKPYDQEAWAALPDVSRLPVEHSLSIVDGLHARWTVLLRELTADQFSRVAVHPEMGDVDVDFLLQLYGWHGHHHTTQITDLRARSGWG
jgi:hypothetical protein